jgi:hypothetical protein
MKASFFSIILTASADRESVVTKLSEPGFRSSGRGLRSHPEKARAMTKTILDRIAFNIIDGIVDLVIL